MKKLSVLAVVPGVFLVGCAPVAGVAQRVVSLPSPLQLAILSGATFLVTWLFSAVAARIPWLAGFLGQYVDEVAAAVGGAVILAIQNYLNAVPPEWEGVANSALALLVAVLAAIGLIKTARKAKVAGFRSAG